LYRTVNDSRFVHGHGADSYNFPSLPVGLSQDQNSGTAEKRGFRFSFGDKAAAPEFSAMFNPAEEEALDAADPVEAVEAESEAIREQAYAKGLVEGQKVGEEAQKEKLKEILKALDTVLSELDAAKTELYRDAERQAVELGLMIARKIVCREVSVDRDTIFRVLREAFKKVSDQKEIHVKIHPSDIQVIKDAGFDVSSLSKGNGLVVLEPGDGICRGECVIETDFGAIDARIESQLQTVEESLRLALQEGASAL
jgi:flagellar biosynthesis/type III secretory pathway protein FliH